MNEFHHPPTARTRAVLSEILSLLKRLCETGKTGTIDLHDPPLEPVDRHNLRITLGEGEVAATVDELGPSYIFETGIAGVWWVARFNERREITVEYIEVANCPKVVCTHANSLDDSVSRLQALLDQTQAESAPVT